MGVFIRGLSNLKAQLEKAEDQCSASGRGEGALLDARLGGAGDRLPYDLHTYTLAEHVHWAAEGARLAVARLLGDERTPAANEATTFPDLYGRLEETIASLRAVSGGDLEPGLDRTITIDHRRGTMESTGRHYLLAFAIPHFYYHVTTAYGILRNEGVSLKMSDFLGDWTANVSPTVR